MLLECITSGADRLLSLICIVLDDCNPAGIKGLLLSLSVGRC